DCTSASAKARINAKCPVSTMACSGSLFGVLPDSLVLEAVGDFLGHVVLVVLGQHRVRHEGSVGGDRSLGDDPLALAAKIGQDAMIAHGTAGSSVTDRKADFRPSPADYRAFVDQPAEPDPLAGAHLCGLQVARHVKIG